MITLNAGQEKAASDFIGFLADPDQNEMVLEGPAGTGKSTLVRHLFTNIENQMEFLKLVMGDNFKMLDSVQITATTHKAAHVISEVLGCEVVTIHSLLKLQIRNNYRTGETYLEDRDKGFSLEPGLLMIDEASFITPELMNYIRAKAPHSKILYIGDPFQLAPTGYKDPVVFNCNLPTARLTDIVRNQGAIQHLSTQFRHTVEHGTFKEINVQDGSVLRVDGATFQQLVDKAFTDKEENIKILAWSNARVHDYNEYVRELLKLPEEPYVGMHLITNNPIGVDNPKAKSIKTDSHVWIREIYPAEELECEGWYLRVQDKAGSSHSVFMPKNRSQATAMMKHFAKNKQWHEYFQIKESWADLRPPHACTVHKSQGSTYDRVFIDLKDIGRCNIPSDVARMLYVAISRASKQVILYGELPPKYRGMTNEKAA